jgi:hypothetical protein
MWVDRAHTITIHVRSISEDLYDYLSTLNVQQNTSGNPFAQPANVYGNIENGFGIFAGLNSASKIFSKPSFEISHVNPGQGRSGDEITITLDGISILPANEMDIGVVFEAAEFVAHAFVHSRTGNTITFTVPDLAATGKLWVAINGRVREWDQEFIVLH